MNTSQDDSTGTGSPRRKRTAQQKVGIVRFGSESYIHRTQSDAINESGLTAHLQLVNANRGFQFWQQRASITNGT